MDFYAVLDQVLELLQRRGRVSYRALKLQFHLDDEHLEALKEKNSSTRTIRWPMRPAVASCGLVGLGHPWRQSHQRRNQRHRALPRLGRQS